MGTKHPNTGKGDVAAGAFWGVLCLLFALSGLVMMSNGEVGGGLLTLIVGGAGALAFFGAASGVKSELDNKAERDRKIE